MNASTGPNDDNIETEAGETEFGEAAAAAGLHGDTGGYGAAALSGDEPEYAHADFRQQEMVEQDLGLNQDDDALPWLDTDYDENENDTADRGKLIGFAALLLSLVALAAGVMYWLNQRASQTDLTADGSTIAAPAGPIKEAPSDVGGKTFEGTGNVAPGVGEGMTHEGQVADDNDPRPSITSALSGAGTSSQIGGGAGGAKTPPARADGASGDPAAGKIAPIGASAGSSGGYVVQVGAFSSEAGAQAGWVKLQQQSDELKGLSHRIEQGQVDGGKVFRLQVVSGNEGNAKSLCARLKSGGIACQVKR